MMPISLGPLNHHFVKLLVTQSVVIRRGSARLAGKERGGGNFQTHGSVPATLSNSADIGLGELLSERLAGGIPRAAIGADLTTLAAPEMPESLRR